MNEFVYIIFKSSNKGTKNLNRIFSWNWKAKIGQIMNLSAELKTNSNGKRLCKSQF